MTVLIVALVIGTLIVVHELGHFLAAKKAGVKVEKFSIGFGPKVLSKKIKQTEYILSLIPLGGYVKLAGEQIDEKREPLDFEFYGQKPWKKAFILLAGAFMNLLLGWVIFCSLQAAGMPYFRPIVGEVKEGEPAFRAGLKTGDMIVEIDGKKIVTWEERAGLVFLSPGKKMDFTVQRDSSFLSMEITPRVEEEADELRVTVRRGLIGILPLEDETFILRRGPLGALREGTLQTVNLVKMIYSGIWQMATGAVSPRQLGGPFLSPS